MSRTVPQQNPKPYRSTIIKVIDVLKYIKDHDNVSASKMYLTTNLASNAIRPILDFLIVEGYINKIKNLGDGTRTEYYYIIDEAGIKFLESFSQIEVQVRKMDVIKEIRSS